MTLSRRRFLRWGIATAGLTVVSGGSNLLAYNTGPTNRSEAICHSDLTKKSLELFLQHHPQSNLKSFQREIVQGSIEEDNKPFYTNCAKHYFNPKSRLGLHTILGQTDALTYAHQLWQQALVLHSEERVRPSHHTLGRVVHLLEDMGSPAHVLLVDHLIKSFKGENNQMFDEDYLKKLKLMGVDLLKNNMVLVLDKGDPYEEWSAQQPLTKQPQNMVKSNSLEELIVGMANEIAQPQDRNLAQALKNNYIFNPKGNGHYASRTASKTIPQNDAQIIANRITPKIIERVAGLFWLWENHPEQKIISGPKIAYHHNETLIIANLQGQTLLERKIARVPNYQWSSDGQKLLISGFKSPIYILNLNSKQKEKLPQGHHFSWSSDSQRIVYDRADNIYIDNQKITHNQRINSHPSWSPDSNFIVFDSYKPGSREIRIIDIQTNQETSLTPYQWQNSPYGQSQFQWLSDSQSIIYQSKETGSLQIFSINPKTKSKKQLTSSEDNYSAVPSTKGNLIAFISERDGQPEIYLMNFNGQNQQRLSHNQAISAPTWNPVDNQIMYSSINGKIYSINISNKEVKEFKKGIKPLFSPR